jgi:hypothetical protein
MSARRPPDSSGATYGSSRTSASLVAVASQPEMDTQVEIWRAPASSVHSRTDNLWLADSRGRQPTRNLRADQGGQSAAGRCPAEYWRCSHRTRLV